MDLKASWLADRKASRTWSDSIKERINIPLRLILSRSAQKTYLSTALVTITSFFLACTACVAFWLFYWQYVPQAGIERPIHLQYGHKHPYGDVTFLNSLITNQAYDITLFLDIPRTPTNVAIGNFMLSTSLYASPISSTPPPFHEMPSAVGYLSNNTIAQASRPATLTYASPLTANARNAFALPLYLTRLSRDSEILSIPMFEQITFSGRKSRYLPSAARLIIESDQKIQIYTATIRITAKLSGIRWLLYNHRIFSCILFSAIFWSTSMFSMGVAWLFLSFVWSNKTASKDEPQMDEDDRQQTIKTEAEDAQDSLDSTIAVKEEAATHGDEDNTFDPASLSDLSDTSRTFPTLSRQIPLKYSSSQHARRDQQQQGQLTPIETLHRPPFDRNLQHLTTAEADDEEEIDDRQNDSATFRDSGIGTGREDSQAPRYRDPGRYTKQEQG